MAQQGQYPLNGRTPIGTDTATGVVAGATADIPLSDIAGLAPLATTSSPGLVEPDGTTITIIGGVISAASGSGVVQSVVAGTGIAVDSTDPANPVVSSTVTGTVSSVGLTAPSQFAVTGSPVTGSGTLAVAWASQNANRFLASPDGTSGVPGFRAVVAGDLPVATTSAFGAVKPDGTTITVTAGVIAAAHTGTVTSVAMTAPAQFSIAGSPITGAGTLAVTWATQTTNLVLASPNGSTGVPTFRTLVAADITGVATSGANSNITSLTGLTTPLTVAQGGMGAGTHTAHGVLIGEGTSAVAATVAGTAGQVLTSGGASADPGWTSPGQPYFSVSLASAQSITATTTTQVAFDTKAFDSGSYFNTTTHVFTPLVAGKYMVTLSLTVTTTLAGTGSFFFQLRKNSTGIFAITLNSPTVGVQTLADSLSQIVVMNGTTDTIDAAVNLAGSSITVNGGTANSFLQAFYIGP